MTDALEKGIPDGSFFRGPRIPSPTRSASTASDPSSSRSPSPAAKTTNTMIQQGGPQTGPKGVRADRDAAVAREWEQKRIEVHEVNERLRKLALQAGTWYEQEKLAARHARLEEEFKELEQRTRGQQSDSDEDDVGEDQEALQRYRAQRLREIAASKRTTSSLRACAGLHGKAPHYGQLLRTDAQEYASVIDDVPSGTSVVVHIGSDLVQSCRRLESTLHSLASSYPTTRFVQVRAIDIGFGLPVRDSAATESSDEDDDEISPGDGRLRELAKEDRVADVVPTLLVYRDGDVVANLVRVDLEEGYGQGDEQDVERLLRTHRALEQEKTYFDIASNDSDQQDSDEYE